jgi:signal peptidase complex subunit 1
MIGMKSVVITSEPSLVNCETRGISFNRFFSSVLFGAVGLVWGYTIQQFSQTVYILGAGMLLASLLTIPPWGIFRYTAHFWKINPPPPLPRKSADATCGRKYEKGV